MKIPCEVIVWHILPIIRREIANELVSEHGMSQAEVARKFGVTDAAISQYLKKKRGNSSYIENLEKYPLLLEEIKKSAKSLSEEKTEIEFELCRLCHMVRNIGLLDEIYLQEYGVTPVPCSKIGGFYTVDE